MRNTKTNTICTLALGAILTIGFNAAADIDPNMEGVVACSSAECMFSGLPQTNQGLGSLQKVPNSVARLQNVNIYADHANQVADSLVDTQLSPIGELVSTHDVTSGGQTGTSQGTAFLVSPCYLLTAAHVIFGDNHFPDVNGDYTMNFKIGKKSDGSFSTSAAATPDMRLMSYTGNTDWALVKLPDSKCFGVHPNLGWYEATGNKPMKGTPAVAFGFGGNHRDQLSYGAGVVRGVSANGMYRFDGSSTHGSSGGPVLTVENGVTKVLGLITKASDPKGTSLYSKYEDAFSNRFESVDSILNNPAVKAVLDADKERFGGQNSASQRLTRPLPGYPAAST